LEPIILTLVSDDTDFGNDDDSEDDAKRLNLFRVLFVNCIVNYV